MKHDLIALRHRRTGVLVCFDAGVWLLATVAAAFLRTQGVDDMSWRETLVVGAGLATVYIAIGMPLRFHEGRARTASFDEMLLMGSMALLAGAVLFVANLFTLTVPRTCPSSPQRCSWSPPRGDEPCGDDWPSVSSRPFVPSAPPSPSCSSAPVRPLAS